MTMRVHVTDLADRNPAQPFTAELATVCGDDVDCCTEVAEVLARDSFGIRKHSVRLSAKQVFTTSSKRSPRDSRNASVAETWS
jgi:hypothetical protein